MYADTVLLAASPTDRAFVAVGLVGSLVLRPLCSGLAHLMYPQNERSYVLWWGVDYVSICVSIFCTCAVFGRFTFYCLPDQQSFFYVSLVGLFLSTVVSVLFVSSNGVRTGSFLLFVLFATGVPFWYSLANKWAGGAANDAPSHYLLLWVASLGCFLVGLIFKSSGFPETMACSCVRPGAFDIVGYSHWFVRRLQQRQMQALRSLCLPLSKFGGSPLL
jgi:predicted membrane channel-forming protein YqfA (hemolysin III family)